MVGEDVRAVAIFAWEVGSAADNLTANFRLHVHRRDVTIQMVLGHVLIAAVLTLIFLDI